jgi:HAD superfamily hydrolase (TIGR01493 family)
MRVRAILFDLGDTLFGLDPLPADLGDWIAEALSASEASPAGRSAEIARAGLESLRRGLLESFAAGDLAEADLAALAVTHFTGAGARMDAALGRALADLFGRADVARFRPTPDAASRVEGFTRAGYRLAAVSNTTTSPALLKEFLGEVELLPLFETVVFSCEAGVRKPHPDIYRQALATLGVEPEMAVFVGDRVREDVRGPQSLGIRAVLTHEFRAEDPGDSEPLAVIGRIDELHGLIEGL